MTRWPCKNCGKEVERANGIWGSVHQWCGMQCRRATGDAAPAVTACDICKEMVNDVNRGDEFKNTPGMHPRLPLDVWFVRCQKCVQLHGRIFERVIMM